MPSPCNGPTKLLYPFDRCDGCGPQTGGCESAFIVLVKKHTGQLAHLQAHCCEALLPEMNFYFVKILHSGYTHHCLRCLGNVEHALEPFRGGTLFLFSQDLLAGMGVSTLVP